MNEKTELQKVSEETMRFMRGKYVLDEVGNGRDELKFRRGGKTVLTIYIRDDRYDFLVIFGRAEREKFEAVRNEFPRKIQEIYDNSKTYHDGKWMSIPVDNLETLEAVKQMVMIKKKPSRKPFPKEGAIYSDCGHRCDLCVHFNAGAVDKDFRIMLMESVNRVYDSAKTADESQETLPMCNGCGISGFGEGCPQRDCAEKKGFKRCLDCPEYDCGKATAGIKPLIHTGTYLADDVTWAILPYVAMQYGN